jgi:protein-S-isoprenylcysteine O-methyltransferase Ste14
MRWAIYFFFLVVIVVYLLTSYRRDAGSKKKRKSPLGEILAASVAFSAWGLVMPGSPLSAVLEEDDLTVWTVIITVGGVFLVGVLAGSLKNPVSE